MSGPSRNALKPNSRAHRGGDRQGRVVLPREGVDLPIPDPPATTKFGPAQKARYESLWQSPQSSQWDESVAGQVALLVVLEDQLLAGNGSAWAVSTVQTISDSLGLTPKAMAHLGWVLSDE